MKILITAGNTQTPIDKVRCVTNIFTGRTGAELAIAGLRLRHHVSLLTSHPESVVEHFRSPLNGQCDSYRTFHDLQRSLKERITKNHYDIIIHAAAVSDYELEGVFVPVEAGTERIQIDGKHYSLAKQGKIKSNHPHIYMKMVKTPKIIDQFRSEWGYRGKLVKFKLEVDISEERLLEIAEASRVQSQADLIIANRLEDYREIAWIGPIEGRFLKIKRADLAGTLFQQLGLK